MHTSSTLFKILLKSTKKCGYDTPKEPFKKLVTQGMVCHETFKTKEENPKWVNPNNVLTEAGKFYTIDNGKKSMC